MANEIRLVTVATHKSGYIDLLIASCKKAGIQLEILGLGKSWEGLKTKLKFLREFLHSVKPETIVVLIDAYDVVMLGTKEELLQRYLLFNKPVVLGIESKRSWLKWTTEKFYFGTYKNEIINTGGYMGRADFLLTMTKNFDSTSNDQLTIMNTANENKEWFEKYTAIDTESDIFYNGACDSFLAHFHITNCNIGLKQKDGKLYKDDGIQPIFLHGPGCIDISPYLRAIGWNAESPDGFKYFLQTIKDYKFTILTGICVIILIIVAILALVKYFGN